MSRSAFEVSQLVRDVGSANEQQRRVALQQLASDPAASALRAIRRVALMDPRQGLRSTARTILTALSGEIAAKDIESGELPFFDRCRELLVTLWSVSSVGGTVSLAAIKDVWDRLGIRESINTPEERP